MWRPVLFGLACAAALVAGCGGGGGGGGGDIVLSGTVLNVITGISPGAPGVIVTAGGAIGTTDAATGEFALQVASGTASITLDGSPVGLGTFTYTFPPVTSATDLGFLYVGPDEVTFEGRVLDAETLDPLADVTVAVLARTGTTGANGDFSVPNVAWTCAGDIFVQWTIHFEKDGYVPRDTPVEGVCIGSVLTMSDVLLAPESSIDPPPGPSDIYGFVTEPGSDGSYVLVELRLRADNTLVAAFVTGQPADPPTGLAINQYGFWVPVGEYRLDFFKPFDTSRATADADLTNLDEPVRVDVTLN